MILLVPSCSVLFWQFCTSSYLFLNKLPVITFVQVLRSSEINTISKLCCNIYEGFFFLIPNPLKTRSLLFSNKTTKNMGSLDPFFNKQNKKAPLRPFFKSRTWKLLLLLFVCLCVRFVLFCFCLNCTGTKECKFVSKGELWMQIIYLLFNLHKIWDYRCIYKTTGQSLSWIWSERKPTDKQMVTGDGQA